MGRDTRYSEFRVVYCRHRVDMPFVMLIGSTEFLNRLFFGGGGTKLLVGGSLHPLTVAL